MASEIPLKLLRSGGSVSGIGEMPAGDFVPVASGGTGATTASGARTALGLDAAGIKSLYEGNADTNAFTDALISKLNGIEAGANDYAHPNHSGDVTSLADGATTIAAGVVTNGKLADVATGTLKGRDTAGTGSPEDLTIGGLTEEASPGAGHLLLADVGGALRKIDVANLPTGGGGESNLGANVGTAGVGVFKGKNGITLEFKTLNAGSSKINVSDDVANDEVDLDLVPGNVLTSTLNNDAGWTANSSDATLLNRANHTGTQLLATISDAGALASLATVGTAQIDDEAVSNAKLAHVATSTIKGRSTAATGDVEDLTPAQARSLLNVEDGATANTGALADLDTVGAAQIDDGSATNAKLADMGAWTLKARNAGTTGDPEDVNAAALTEEATPAGGDLLLGWDSVGNLRKFDVGNLPTGGGGEVNTGLNVGTAGVGVFKQKSGLTLEFKKLNVGSTKLSVTDDTGNDEVDLDVVPGNILTSTLNNDAGWTANSSDAVLLARANHTGTQALSTISDAGVLAGLNSVSATEIDDESVTLAKIQHVATATFLGRTTAATGDVESLTAAQARGVLNVADGATANSADAVLLDRSNHTGTQLLSTISDSGALAALDTIATAQLDDGAATNAKLADMAAWTVKVRNAGTTGVAADAAVADLTEEPTPAGGDFLLGWDGAGNLRKFDVGDLPTGGGGEVNDGANIGTAGVGIYKGKSGISLQFKKLNAGSSKVTVVDDVGNDEVDLDIAPGNIDTSTLNNDAGWNNYSHPNHSGDVTSTGDGATVIAADAVTLAKMANMATESFLGRATTGIGDPEVLSAASARAVLNVEDGSTANSPDATLLARANHTGTQAMSTISDAGALATLNSVATAQVDDEAVTLAKLAHVVTDSFLGRGTTGTGDVEVLSAATARGVLNVADGATANSSDAVLLDRANHTGTQTLGTISDSGALAALSTVGTAEIDNGAVTLAKLQDIATDSFIGRRTAASGDPEVLTAAHARTILNVEDGATADQTAIDIRALGFFDTTNDGTGSGLDADLVDGNEAAALLARANHTGTQTLATISDSGALAALNTVGSAEIDAAAVGTSELADAGVTLAKMADLAQSTIVGRAALAGTGVPTALTPGQVRTLLNYQASQVDNDSAVAGATVAAALDQLDTDKYDSADAVSTSSGASDTGKLMLLGATGELDAGFVPHEIGELLPFTPRLPGSTLFGTGTPADSIGAPGDAYYEEDTGETWFKEVAATSFPLSPSSSGVDYTPSDVSTSHASQRASVFKPAGTEPASGWKWILYSAAGNFLEHSPPATIDENSRPGRMIKQGYVVVWMGSTGLNSTGIGTDPGMFWEPGSAGFDDYTAANFFPEKDAIWCLQFFKQNAATYGLNASRCGVMGPSSGGQTVFWGPAGPDPTFTGSDPMLSQSLAIDFAIVDEVPTWWDAYLGTTTSFAAHFPTTGDAAASSIANADDAVLKEASIDYRVRQASSNISACAVYLAYDEPLKSEDFGRTGGDPDLTNTLDSSTELHSSWFGYALVDAIATQSTNRLDESEFFVKRAVHRRGGSHTKTATVNANDGTVYDDQSEWAAEIAKPGTWASQGFGPDVTGPTTLGRAVGSGKAQALTGDQTLAVAWSARTAHQMLAKNAAGTLIEPFTVGVNGLVGRSNGGLVGSRDFLAGEIAYFPRDAGTYYTGLGTLGLNLAALDSGLRHEAAVDPVVGDDSADNFVPGSMWVNTATDDAFVALDVSAGAAVWKKLTGDLAALDTVGSTEIDDAAVTYAKIQDVSGATLLGRGLVAGSGDVTELTGDACLAITWSEVAANTILRTTGTIGQVGELIVPANGVIGRNGTGVISGVALGTAQIMYNDGSLGTQPWDLDDAILDRNSGTSFPGAPVEGRNFYRTDLESSFEYDSSRSKWLVPGTPAAFITRRNGWSSGNVGLIDGLGVGSFGGFPIAFDFTIVGMAIRCEDSSTGTFRVVVRNSAGTDTNGDTLAISSERVGTSMAFDTDGSAGDAIYVDTTAGTITGNVFVQVFYKRRAS